MNTVSVTKSFSPRVQEALKTAAMRVKIFPAAQLMWDRMLTDEDRARLGDLETAWCQRGTAGMYQFLNGVSSPRAVTEIAFGIGLLDPGSRTWLLREIGELYDDPQRTVDAAISAGHLVLIENPKAAFWHGQPIEIDWEKDDAQWKFLWALCQRSKKSLTLTQVDLGEQVSVSSLSTCKGRLVNHPDFPKDLSILVESKRGNGYYMDLPPAEIRLFLVEEHDVAVEWTGQTSPFADMLTKLTV